MVNNEARNHCKSAAQAYKLRKQKDEANSLTQGVGKIELETPSLTRKKEGQYSYKKASLAAERLYF
jgi:hypothetical protein